MTDQADEIAREWLEALVKIANEARNAALEEAATVPVPFRHANTEAARAIHAAIRALKEKP